MPGGRRCRKWDFTEGTQYRAGVPLRSTRHRQAGSQVEWNPYEHDEDMLAFCKAHGIQLQARNGVFLTRSHVQRTTADDAFMHAFIHSFIRPSIHHRQSRPVAANDGTERNPSSPSLCRHGHRWAEPPARL